jgi:hypothetical protein
LIHQLGYVHRVSIRIEDAESEDAEFQALEYWPLLNMSIVYRCNATSRNDAGTFSHRAPKKPLKTLAFPMWSVPTMRPSRETPPEARQYFIIKTRGDYVASTAY